MSWGIYGILVIFGLFVLLLILNPNLTCFGRRLKSPLYPVLRKKKRKRKTEDYGFELVDDGIKLEAKEKKQKMKEGAYGFSRVGGYAEKESSVKKKKLRTQDYGFSLADDQTEQDAQEEKENKDSAGNK
ncbi:MAG: hypothetical protein V3U91_02540 [Candidatus Aminicenantaceae bacterium]